MFQVGDNVTWSFEEQGGHVLFIVSVDGPSRLEPHMVAVCRESNWTVGVKFSSEGSIYWVHPEELSFVSRPKPEFKDEYEAEAWLDSCAVL